MEKDKEKWTKSPSLHQQMSTPNFKHQEARKNYQN
jgi:hypothetical protein